MSVKSKWRSYVGDGAVAGASLFLAENYREVLYARLAEHRNERGYQKRLAEAAACRPSYLSQILNSHVQLTPDQAAGIAEFWRLGEDETEYFLGLVGLERSSSTALKRHLQRRQSQLREKHTRLSTRVEAGAVSSLETQTYYYSSWYAPAVHVLLGNKNLRSAAALSAYLHLPESLIRTCLDQLVAGGLVLATGAGYVPTEKSLHLGDQSPLLSVYHANWRQQATHRLQQRIGSDLHYTALYAVGAKEQAEIRETLLQTITKSRAIAAASPEEGIAVAMMCDFYPL